MLYQLPWLNDLGNYYIAEINTDNIIQTDVDLEVLAREEGAIKSSEAITAELQRVAPSSKALRIELKHRKLEMKKMHSSHPDTQRTG